MNSVSREEIAEGFRAVGARPGDTLMFHTSLRSMGHVAGGAVSVIDGALDAVSPGGTIAMATLWYNGKPLERKREDFDLRTSPAWNGAVPEALRRDPRSVRSCHFSHSVSAIGPRAEELTRDHGAGPSAPSPWSEDGFAESSPWGRFYRWNALYAFIGCDMNSCTLKHYLESRYVTELLQLLPEECRQEFRKKLAWERTPGPWCGYDGCRMRLRLAQLGLIRETRVGEALVFALRSRPLVDESLAILRKEAEEWFTPQFLAWRAGVLDFVKGLGGK